MILLPGPFWGVFLGLNIDSMYNKCFLSGLHFANLHTSFVIRDSQLQLPSLACGDPRRTPTIPTVLYSSLSTQLPLTKQHFFTIAL